MIKINNPSDCCGCTACASICAHDAISMEPDALGFLYPKVDASKCVECGLCEKVCQFNDNYDRSLNFKEPIAYAARHKNINEIMKSRSGAAFVAISDYVLEQGGVVYGAGYKDHFRVAHKRATTKEERDEFRGSKYVQSDLTGVFRQVKEDLKNGLTVLFSGTPCQTAGLNAFIGKKLRQNLILVDIVCHAVPSPFIWRDYINYIEIKYGSKISKSEFRDKRAGWDSPHKECFTMSDGSIHTDFIHRFFFYKSLSIRISCGNCKYTNYYRPSDITLGDFWGYERCVPTMNIDNCGISLVLLNSQKGVSIFDKVTESLDFEKVSLISTYQWNLEHPTQMNKSVMEFQYYYSSRGFNYVLKKYGPLSYSYKLKLILKKICHFFCDL